MVKCQELENNANTVECRQSGRQKSERGPDLHK